MFCGMESILDQLLSILCKVKSNGGGWGKAGTRLCPINAL